MDKKDMEPRKMKMEGWFWKCPKCQNFILKSLWFNMITENIKAHAENHHANQAKRV